MNQEDDFAQIITDLFRVILRMHAAAEVNCVLLSFDWLSDEATHGPANIIMHNEKAGAVLPQVFFAAFKKALPADDRFPKLKMLIGELEQAYEMSLKTIYGGEEGTKQ